MSNYGHYGWRSMAILGLAVAGIIIHFAVPWNIVWTDEDGADATKRGEVADAADASGDAWVTAAGPGLTLVGLILLAVGGLLLTLFGFLPMPTEGARWAGWTGGFVSLVGGMLTFTSSMFWVGQWFATLLTLGSDSIQQFIDFYLMLSPVLVAAIGGMCCWWSLRTLEEIVTIKDGHRNRTADHLEIAGLAIAFMGLVAAVPWSLHDPSGGDYEWVSAFGVQLANDSTDVGGADATFGSMSYAISVMLITGWIVTMASVMAGTAGMFANIPGTAQAVRVLPAIHGISLFMLAWTAIVYILAWTYMWKPTDGAEDYLPGFFPVLVLAAFIPMAYLVGKGFVDTAKALKPMVASAGQQQVQFE